MNIFCYSHRVKEEKGIRSILERNDKRRASITHPIKFRTFKTPRFNQETFNILMDAQLSARHDVIKAQ